MFQKLLVANRGEIAMRVMRACKELGIATVAVYTELDRDCRHVRMADHAYNLGEASYLDMQALWAIAREAGVDAIHPGYGFLSENAEFAQGCLERQLTWVGPKPDAIRQMGSKLAARQVAIAHDVPIVPGRTEPITHAQEVIDFGTECGYPLLIKAASGGGGRGQVVIHHPAEAASGLEKAQREGQSYFGDPTVYVERFLVNPRHIEVQIIADQHGTVAHLGERDCSIQRRNQKLVEESPSPALNPTLRDAIGEAACRIARGVGYDSMGTVEFMFEDGQFYFLEMNTRIQVEHTVTEEVYRCDLVKEMINVAAKHPLNPELIGRKPQGWAIQVRLNAEDPSNNYRPTPGYLSRYERPEGIGVRLDGAAYEGWTIPSAYDSMIAKLITTGSTRDEAIARMRRALDETHIEGVTTTVPLHRVIMLNPTFISGNFSTRFLTDNLSEAERAEIAAECQKVNVTTRPDNDATPRTFAIEVNRQLFHVSLRQHGASSVAVANRNQTPTKPKALANKRSTLGGAGDGGIVAPMMSRVVKTCVAVGDAVKSGQTLVVIEAMKMESEITAPKDGTIKSLHCQAGDTVNQGQVLISLG
jgi:acetyl-CoA/propionyl-CoA carboxylase biotin carboxyl carrier protein